jgi:hypothetical protein
VNHRYLSFLPASPAATDIWKTADEFCPVRHFPGTVDLYMSVTQLERPGLGQYQPRAGSGLSGGAPGAGGANGASGRHRAVLPSPVFPTSLRWNASPRMKRRSGARFARWPGWPWRIFCECVARRAGGWPRTCWTPFCRWRRWWLR